MWFKVSLNLTSSVKLSLRLGSPPWGPPVSSLHRWALLAMEPHLLASSSAAEAPETLESGGGGLHLFATERHLVEG